MTNLTNKLFLPVFMLLLSISPAAAHNDTFFNSPHRLELKPASFAEGGIQLAKSYWLGGADLDLNFKDEDDKTRCNSMGYFQEACQGNKSPLLKCPYNSAYFKCTCDTSIYRYSALNCPPGSYPDEDVCDDYSKGCVCENNKIWSAEDNSCVGCLSDSDCADGKECNNRECVNIDLCAGVNCTGGQSCNSETGACECPSGEVFYNNRCEAPSCTNKEIQCSGSTPVCAANGQCVECVSASDCGANEICSGNTCQTVDRCKDVSCSGGKSCNPNNGQCECPSDKPYESGGVCEAPNCVNGGLSCPSGQTCNKTTKVCEDSARIIPCKVGDTLYSDIHCYDGIPAGKKAIATVFDTQKGLAAALTRRELKWFNGSTDMTKTDVSQLENCSSSVDKTKCSTDGKSNTIKIINHAGSSKSSYEAANYCYSYTTEGTKAGDWFLPSAAEMDKIITSIDALGQYWDSYWTSIEMNGNYAWKIGENSVGGVPQGKSYISSSQKTFKNYVRPVIAYNDLTPVEPDCTNGGIICAADEKCNETTGKCETDYAEILYSDKTTSVNLIPGKTAIGIVVDSSRRLAVALAYEDRQWESADNVDVINGKTKLTNLSALADIDSGNTKTSFSGKTNTQTIVNNCGKCLAAKYANEYVTSGTKAGDWYLPASGELWLMYQRKAAINRTLSKLGKSTVLTSGSYAWSSSESSYTNAGNGSVRIPTAWGIRTTGEISYISKHLYHKVYPMITY